MCNFATVVKRIIPFAVAFGLGVFVFSLFPQMVIEPPKIGAPSRSGISIGGTGHAIGHGGSGLERDATPASFARTEKFLITSKPTPLYTDAARMNGVEGTIRLKVTLLASGNIGGITPLTELSHGLTEQAIEAARQIKFHPKRVNGVPQSVIVTVDYNFNLY